MKKKAVIIYCILGVMALSVYSIDGVKLSRIFMADGNTSKNGYDVYGNTVFPPETELPIPTGNLTAARTIPLPDLYEDGKGFTCTGLTSDGEYYYIGDIGTLSGTNYRSQIVVTRDFINVARTIPLYTIPGFQIVQGITFDSSDDTLWCCDASGKIYHITLQGEIAGSISMSSPTGIVYSEQDDTLWVLTYANKIIHMTKAGTIIESYDFAYLDKLDQCFLDETRGYMYITAGENYSGRNNVYLFDLQTHEQSIACTVDSYAVEGIIIEPEQMIILNDGYYHSAIVNVNQANIYDLN